MPFENWVQIESSCVFWLISWSHYTLFTEIYTANLLSPSHLCPPQISSIEQCPVSSSVHPDLQHKTVSTLNLQCQAVSTQISSIKQYPPWISSVKQCPPRSPASNRDLQHQTVSTLKFQCQWCPFVTSLTCPNVPGFSSAIFCQVKVIYISKMTPFPYFNEIREWCHWNKGMVSWRCRGPSMVSWRCQGPSFHLCHYCQSNTWWVNGEHLTSFIKVDYWSAFSMICKYFVPLSNCMWQLYLLSCDLNLYSTPISFRSCFKVSCVFFSKVPFPMNSLKEHLYFWYHTKVMYCPNCSSVKVVSLLLAPWYFHRS